MDEEPKKKRAKRSFTDEYKAGAVRDRIRPADVVVVATVSDGKGGPAIINASIRVTFQPDSTNTVARAIANL